MAACVHPITVTAILVIATGGLLVAHTVGGIALAILVAAVALAVVFLLRKAVLPPECDRNVTQRCALTVLGSMTVMLTAAELGFWPIISAVCEHLGVAPTGHSQTWERLTICAVVSIALAQIHAPWVRAPRDNSQP